MKNQRTWKILDVMIAVVMFSLALGMLIAGGWFN
jgi:arginine exporter protein ArgO